MGFSIIDMVAKVAKLDVDSNSKKYTDEDKARDSHEGLIGTRLIVLSGDMDEVEVVVSIIKLAMELPVTKNSKGNGYMVVPATSEDVMEILRISEEKSINFAVQTVK